MKRILAVEDDPAVAECYRELFSGAGYEVRTAEDVTAGVVEFEDFKPHLVILDAEIPFGGGERVFEIVKELASGAVPVIFVTGVPERVDRFMLKHARVRVFRKPVKSEELLSCVSEMLSSS